MKYEAKIVFEHTIDEEEAKDELEKALIDEGYEDVQVTEFKEVEE